MKHFITATYCGVIAFGLVACASTGPADEPAGAALESYTAEEIQAEAKALLDAQGVPAKTQASLLGRLGQFLAKESVQKDMSARGITAIAAYQAGEGGFLYKAAKGSGYASFNGGDQRRAFALMGHAVGAVAGGGSSNGLVIVFGLADQRRFAGVYSSSGFKATAMDAGGSSGVAKYKGDGESHKIHYLSSGAGMSAEAGIGKFQVSFK